MVTLCTALLLVCTGAVPTVEQWDTHEVVLQGASAYSEGNPFRDVLLEAQFVHEGGTQLTIQGFHDGDGVGGQVGLVWKLRFMPTLAGDWTWVTSSNDSQLNGVAGSLTATAPSGA